MNRQVVSSTVLTQSYSFSYSILIYLSIRLFVYSSRCACLWPLDTCVTHSRSHGQMDGWTDR